MPRLAGAVPKYRKHRASAQAFVELNGRRHYLGDTVLRPAWLNTIDLSASGCKMAA
jgi:hypothetical protein